MDLLCNNPSSYKLWPAPTPSWDRALMAQLPRTCVPLGSVLVLIVMFPEIDNLDHYPILELLHILNVLISPYCLSLPGPESPATAPLEDKAHRKQLISKPRLLWMWGYKHLSLLSMYSLIGIHLVILFTFRNCQDFTLAARFVVTTRNDKCSNSPHLPRLASVLLIIATMGAVK